MQRFTGDMVLRQCVVDIVIRGGVHKKGSLKLADIIRSTRESLDFHKAGAIGIFIGVVRGEIGEGVVEKLELEAHEEEAHAVLERICANLSQEKGIVDVQIHHLLGEFESGEELVYVLVAGEHRNDMFPVLQKAVKRFKKEVPVFKKEYVSRKDGKTISYWIGEKKVPSS